MMRLRFADIKYKDRLILAARDIHVQPGFMTVVSGKSGSGKTSLFKALEKDEYACSGQFPLFLDAFSIKEHFDLLEMHPLPSEIQSLGCDSLLDKYPPMLSGGEKKRVSFLLAASRDAAVYMFDEPTASQNEEYVEAFIGVLLRLKREKKAMIVFTHDKRLMELGDICYEIKDHQLVGCGNEAGEDVSECPKAKGMANLSRFVLLAVERQGKGMGNAIMLLLAVLVCLSFSYARILDASQQGILNQMQSNELIVFKGLATMTEDNGSIYYSPNTEMPLGEDELKQLSSIDHVVDAQWRYDVIEKGDALSDDITKEGFDIRGEAGSSYGIEVMEGDNSLGTVELGSCSLSTYMREHKLQKDIVVDYGEDGVYLSRRLANLIEQSIGVDDEGLKGKSMRFSVSLPMYNTFGRWMGSIGDNELTYLWSTTVDHEEVVVPIAGILEWSSFGLPNSNEYAMYVERSILAPLIEKYRAKEDRTLYVETMYYDVWYLNELPENKKDTPMNRVFEDYAWQPTAVSLWTDSVQSVGSVVEKIDEAGYYVVGEFTELGGVWNGVSAAKRMVRIVSFLLAGVYILACFGIKIIGRKKEKEMRGFFLSCGMAKKDLSDALRKAWQHGLAGQLKQVLVIFVGVFATLSIVMRSVLLPSFVGVVVLLSLLFFRAYGLNVLMEKALARRKE